MSLGTYAKKRDFSRTNEPRGKRGRKSAEEHRFVIQKHDASRLHYDFRLELGGALKSWAVPKGLPFKRGEKHLAVRVEDHPLDYASFEGVIPKGQYGGGTVMVWDAGTYEPLSANPKKDLAAGKLHFALHGKKTEGEWTLVRIKHAEDHEWLLIKSGDDVRPVSKNKDNESALTGRTMANIERDRDAEWRSGRSEKKKKLAFVPPMKATLAAAPPESGSWIYELKFDGFRTLALKSGSDVRLLSSNGKDFTARFRELADGVAALRADIAILDGEIVALDHEGRSRFELLQAIDQSSERPPLALYLFDLLQLDGTDLRGEPLHERRAALRKLLGQAKGLVRYSAEIDGDPNRLLAEVHRRGLEGIMGKEADSVYESGRRSRSWMKLKCVAEQELVIGGYTPPEGSRKHFGALLVGYHEGEELHFAGKVGTGFDTGLLGSLHRKLRALESESCPFADLPEKKQGRWKQNITPREMKRCRWVEPRLVCQVRFTEWTRDGKLRHPVFLGLRDDKAATEIIREEPAT